MCIKREIETEVVVAAVIVEAAIPEI